MELDYCAFQSHTKTQTIIVKAVFRMTETKRREIGDNFRRLRNNLLHARVSVCIYKIAHKAEKGARQGDKEKK